MEERTEEIMEEQAVETAEPAAETPAEAPAAEEAKAEPEKVETMDDYKDRLDPNAFEAPKWEHFKEMIESKETFPITIKGVVKGGVVAYLDDVRAFIPSSHIALHRVDDLDSMLEKELNVRVIEADQSKKRLILSARVVLRDEQRDSQKKAIDSTEVGSKMHGTVETIKPYGAFVRLENGLSGLVHVSQIARRRIKTPEDVLKVGEEVDVKVIAIKDGKLSLSIKALLEPSDRDREETPREHVVIPKAEKLSTNLGDLLKGISL